MAVRLGLIGEVIEMAFDTVRANKMRSGLTVLGVVIGITSIVGMTAMIRGFDQSLRERSKKGRRAFSMSTSSSAPGQAQSPSKESSTAR
jgi:hypothetical protein